MKYCLIYEEPKPKKQDYKDRFRSRCLFSLIAASKILEIVYLVDFFIQINDVFDIGITSLANSSASIRSVHFLTCCGFKSYDPDYNQTTDTEDRFLTHDQFANQAAILNLHAIVKILHKFDRLMSVTGSQTYGIVTRYFLSFRPPSLKTASACKKPVLN